MDRVYYIVTKMFSFQKNKKVYLSHMFIMLSSCGKGYNVLKGKGIRDGGSRVRALVGTIHYIITKVFNLKKKKLTCYNFGCDIHGDFDGLLGFEWPKLAYVVFLFSKLNKVTITYFLVYEDIMLCVMSRRTSAYS